MSRNNLRIRRHKRVRSKIEGTSARPRMAVFRSLSNLYVQVIDDSTQKTLVSADLREVFKGKKVENNIGGAEKLGKLIGKKCKEAKISEIVFDRGGYNYHGRISALAEAARGEGLKF
ncbi:MAG: 50S ribosomal protein L18 [Candidatus Moranbacteria bacterium]|nr:50S ribosomal protein L18 [Candidatus Moranbacteria bacterium]